MKKVIKFISMVSAAALISTSVLPLFVKAEVDGDGSLVVNEALADNESLQPLPQGFQVDTLLKWTPESDPDARYARASIPLKKERVSGPLVNPYANPDAKLMVCSLSNSNHDNTPVQGSDSFDSYAFGYWQYVDTMVYWAGSEEGIFVVPTPDIIDSAHKNGVPVTATIGFPWGPDDTKGQIRLKEIDKFIQQKPDGSFPVADKMVEVAQYYGFDGYFFNQETYGGTPKMAQRMAEMMKYVHKKYPDFIFNWYDSMCKDGSVTYQDAVTDLNRIWIEKDKDGLYAADEFFMNYNWGGANGEKTSSKYPDNLQKIPETIKVMKDAGRSPYDAFAGFEVQQNSIATPIRDHLLVDENGKLKLSIALYCPNSTMGFSKDPVDFHEREKRFWVSSTGDPSNEPLDPKKPDNWEWVGMARFFADKTVIQNTPFVTNFNTGHGKHWYIDGKISRMKEWNNRSMQDILPTWTWMIQSDGSKLNGTYDFDDVYYGGSSLKFSGTLDSPNKIMLYSTKLNDMKEAEITYKVNQSGSNVELGICYGDTYDEKNFIYYPLTAGNAGEWTTAKVNLEKEKGKEAIAIALRIDGKIQDYTLNLGKIYLGNGHTDIPSAPSGITVDELAYNTANDAQLRLYWKQSDNADYYEIYRIGGDGKEIFINATPNTAYYIPNLERDLGQKSLIIKVVPVSKSGERGSAAVKRLEWSEEESSYSPAPSYNFENVVLGAKVTAYSGQGEAEPAVKALDGTAQNGSKWCHAGVNEGFMSISLDSPKTIRRWRVEHAQAGGEDAISNTIDFSLQYKDNDGKWQIAKEIKNNTAAITDVILDTPITAKEWKLNITKADGGKWKAVRIYEWQMFESDVLPPYPDIPSRFAQAVNKKGVSDTFSLSHVPSDAVVQLYADSNKTQMIASGIPNNNSIVTINGLKLKPEGGRIYYTLKSDISSESSLMSTAYEAETAEKTPNDQTVRFLPFHLQDSSSKENLSSYVMVQNLQPGDIVSLYAEKDSKYYIKQSLPIGEGEGSVTFSQIPVSKGKSIYLEVKRLNMLPSNRKEFIYK